MKSKGFEIYIHIPFCARKCDYCDFVSFVCDKSVQHQYVDCMIEQLINKAEFAKDSIADSVFIGGGTPSVIAPKEIDRIMNTIYKHYNVSDKPEITMEMNPNSITAEKLAIYKAGGINRVSMGLQSANDSELKVLSRLHSYDEFLVAFERVREAGFANVNVDLMSAVPTQTVASYENSLRKVASLGPEHISAYSLIIEENTPFFARYKDNTGLPTEEDDRQMYHDTEKILSEFGMKRYEISNYSLPGYECRHNVGYWTRKPYLGFGIAAASLWDETRYKVHDDIKRYINKDFSEEKETLTDADIISEYMFLGLRLVDGILVQDFWDKFKKSIDDIFPGVVAKLTKEGLMAASNGRIFLTEKGLDIANYCMSEFIL